MNEEIKRRWVEELRSGKHKQTKGVLCNAEGEKCCLGVLTEIAVKDGVVTKNDAYTSFNYTLQKEHEVFSYGEDCTTGILPVEVQDWAGLYDSNPDVKHEDEWRSLAALNDTEDLTFEEIAYLIETQL